MLIVLNKIKVFAFWGLVFLLILLFGFGVDIVDIITMAMSLEMYLSAFCIYMLLSVIIYPLLAIMILVKNIEDISLIDAFLIQFTPNLWTPYKGFDIRFLFSLPDLDLPGIIHDILVGILRFVDMIIWWGILIFGLYTIHNQGENPILSAINAKTAIQKMAVVGGVLIGYLILKVIIYIANKMFLEE